MGAATGRVVKTSNLDNPNLPRHLGCFAQRNTSQFVVRHKISRDRQAGVDHPIGDLFGFIDLGWFEGGDFQIQGRFHVSKVDGKRFITKVAVENL